MKTFTSRQALLALCTIASSCSHPPRTPCDSIADVQVQIEHSTGVRVGPSLPEGHLQQPLSLSSAIQIALVQNPKVQTAYARLGIAQADVVQAHLLSNPLLSVSLKRLELVNSSYTLEAGIAQSLLDLLQRPARKRQARFEQDIAKIEAQQVLLEVMYATKVSYKHLAAAQAKLALARDLHEIASIAEELARRMTENGNMARIEQLEKINAAQEALLFVQTAELDAMMATEHLIRTLGLREDQLALAHAPLADNSDASAEAPPAVLSEALNRNLFLKKIELQMSSLHPETALALSDKRFMDMSIGFDAERETSGEWLLGPHFETGFPLFDRGQGVCMRQRYQMQQFKEQWLGIYLSTASSARAAQAKLDASQSIARRYQQELIPNADAFMGQSLLMYNAMQIGVFELLHAKRNERLLAIEAVDADLSYWEARFAADSIAAGFVPEKTEPVCP